MAQKLEHREQRIAFEELLEGIRQESEPVERFEKTIREAVPSGRSPRLSRPGGRNPPDKIVGPEPEFSRSPGRSIKQIRDGTTVRALHRSLFGLIRFAGWLIGMLQEVLVSRSVPCEVEGYWPALTPCGVG